MRVTLHAPWPCACTATANAAIPMHSFIARPAAAVQPLVAVPRPSRVGGNIVAARPLLVAVPTSASLDSSQPACLFRWHGEPRCLRQHHKPARPNAKHARMHANGVRKSELRSGRSTAGVGLEEHGARMQCRSTAASPACMGSTPRTSQARPRVGHAQHNACPLQPERPGT